MRLDHARPIANGPSQAGGDLQQQTETTIPDRQARAARNQDLAAFLQKRAEFDALLAELAQASGEHLRADPETAHWSETAWLSDATVKPRDIEDAYFQRGEHSADHPDPHEGATTMRMI